MTSYRHVFRGAPHRLRRARTCLLVLVGGLGLLAREARADEADEARARQAQVLFDRGRELLGSGERDVHEACKLLTESQRLDPGGGTLLNLAVCHEREGRLATAWFEYRDALGLASRDGRVDREALANERIRLVEPRLPHLRVTLSPGGPVETKVSIDGAAVSPLALGTPLPEDPGPHEITASARGYGTWSVRLPALAESQTLEVVVPTLVPLTQPPPTLGSRIAAPAYVAASVAVASYGVMAVTGALALVAQSSADKGCQGPHGFCADPGAPSDATRARALAWASTVALGVALASTAVAIAWPRKRPSIPTLGMATVSVGPFGVAGTF